MTRTFECPVKGHDHDLSPIREHTQAGTGNRAVTYECPTGAYRWFVVDGHEPSTLNRFNRPRHGWKADR